MRLELFFSPHSCPRVSLIAMEEAGIAYEAHLVSLAGGENRSPEFLARNPSAKVPVLLVDGRPVVQTVAILSFLDETFPDAKLLPQAKDPVERAVWRGELVSFSADLHPIVTRIAFPHLVIGEGEAQFTLRARAKDMMAFHLGKFEKRLAKQPWLAGDQWTALDAYLQWIWFRSLSGGFDPAPFPAISSHYARMLERPSVKKVLTLEEAAVKVLESRGQMSRPRL